MKRVSAPVARRRRLNRRAVIVLGALLLVGVPGIIGYKLYRDHRDGTLLETEAKKRLDQNQPHLALQYLNRYLTLNPDDVEALDLKAKILADSVRSADEAAEALPIHNQVLGRDPDNPKRQDTRRRLAELNLRAGRRARLAEALVRDMIKRGANDADTHRLLARALEQAGVEGDLEAYESACREYEVVEKMNPGDPFAAERLAFIYRDKLSKPAKALEVLDRLVTVSRDTPKKRADAHLVRARYFSADGQLDQAAIEIDRALEAEPNNPEVHLAAADAANHRGDTAAARRHLEAIPASLRSALRVKLVEGMIELNERRPDEAIQSWRAGLVQTGGNNAELTWKLAQVLLDIGRPKDAEPLIAQYRRLAGGDEPDALYHYLHGFALLRTDRPNEAITELEAIRHQIPKRLEPHLFYLLGQSYERLNDTAKALSAYRQSTKSNPRWSQSWVAMANLEGADHLREAQHVLEQGRAVSPEDPRLLINLALILWREQMRLPYNQRSWTQVEKTLDAARKVAPHSVELALVTADYLSSVDKTGEALALLEAAAKRSPRSVSLWQAIANLQNRMGHPSQALDTLDRAMATMPEAGIFVLRASILLSLGHVQAARTTLTDARGRVPADQLPQIWKALAQFDLDQNDLAAARKDYEQWAQLQPESPEPRTALFRMALASGNDDAIRASVEDLKNVGGPHAPYWHIARVEELLRDRSDDSSASSENARLEEASKLIRELETGHPYAPMGFMLEGRLLEKRRRIDKAIAAYEKAIALRGGQVALGPLTSMLVREGRDDELTRLRKELGTIPPEIDRLATTQALQLGDKKRAEHLTELMVQGNPLGLDTRVWQARVLNDLGKPKEAEVALQALIRQHPGEPTPLVQLLMLQVSHKQLAEAAETIEQIRKDVRTDRPELLWAQCYRVIGDNDKADKCYQEALRRWPDDITVSSAAVSFFDQIGRRDEAEAVLRHLVSLDPELGWASRALALNLASRDGNRAAWDEALAMIGPTARPGDTPDVRLTRANIYAKGPEPAHRAEAIAILRQLAAEIPNATTVQESLARLLRESGKLDDAREHAAKAVGKSVNPDAVLLYAGTLIDTKRYDEARRELNRLDAPDNPAVAELQARILMAQGKTEDAVAGLERAFDAQLKTADGLVVGEKMIGLLLRMKQPEAAERVARKMPTLGPPGTCVLAMYLGGQGRHDDALKLIDEVAAAGHYDEAGTAALKICYAPRTDPRWIDRADRYLGEVLKKDPDSIPTLKKIAYVRYLQGRYDDQVAAYQKILEQRPDDLLFLNDMAWTLSENLHRPEDGLARADELMKRIGRQPNLLDTRGVILTRLGKLDQAIADLEAATKAVPGGAYYYHLARAYLKKGRKDDFLKARSRAKEVGLRREQLQPSERGEWDELMTN